MLNSKSFSSKHDRMTKILEYLWLMAKYRLYQSPYVLKWGLVRTSEGYKGQKFKIMDACNSLKGPVMFALRTICRNLGLQRFGSIDILCWLPIKPWLPRTYPLQSTGTKLIIPLCIQPRNQEEPPPANRVSHKHKNTNSCWGHLTLEPKVPPELTSSTSWISIHGLIHSTTDLYPERWSICIKDHIPYAKASRATTNQSNISPIILFQPIRPP